MFLCRHIAEFKLERPLGREHSIVFIFKEIHFMCICVVIRKIIEIKKILCDNFIYPMHILMIIIVIKKEILSKVNLLG